MDCATEEQLVRMCLDGVDGVDAVQVDLDRRTVTVSHDGDTMAVKVALDALRLDTTLATGASPPAAQSPRVQQRERRALAVALVINAGFFIAEFAAGVLAHSIGLIADSLDMLADASVYALSLVAVGRTSKIKKQLAAASGYAQFGLAAVGLIEVTRRFLTEEPLPDPRVMVVVSLLALGGNVVTLLLLRQARSDEAHFQASWIFTSNDIKVNSLVIVAAMLVAVTNDSTPDLLAGSVIFVIVANGARRILILSRQPDRVRT